MNHRTAYRLKVLIGMLLAAWAATQLIFVLAQPAAAATIATRTVSLLPDRPTPVGLPLRPAQPKRPINELSGGHIELLIAPVADIWTQIEWQGGDGNWHPVPGWRGYTSKGGAIRWYVEQNDLGKGPYRWHLFLYEDGDDLAVSEPFYLPRTAGGQTTTKVNVPALADFLQ
jgi:hypothetical protein